MHFLQLCAAPGVPLQLDDASSTATQVVLTCPSQELASWLLGERYLAMCPLVPGVSELDALQPSAVLAGEEASMAAAQDKHNSLVVAEARYRKPDQVGGALGPSAAVLGHVRPSHRFLGDGAGLRRMGGTR